MFHAFVISWFMTKNFCVYALHFSYLLSVDKHLNWFCFLATENSVSVNMASHESLWYAIKEGYLVFLF